MPSLAHDVRRHVLEEVVHLVAEAGALMQGAPHDVAQLRGARGKQPAIRHD